MAPCELEPAAQYIYYRVKASGALVPGELKLEFAQWRGGGGGGLVCLFVPGMRFSAFQLRHRWS